MQINALLFNGLYIWRDPASENYKNPAKQKSLLRSINQEMDRNVTEDLLG